ncbi:MAG: DUF4349 domain-containing protein [Lachnospiraceae bacterium]|jgi:hypothetical protein|nr:DUF4349 domain-containing protein [Lachnospiraceae bacterium]
MKIMKKRVVLLTGLIITSVILSACSAGSNDPSYDVSMALAPTADSPGVSTGMMSNRSIAESEQYDMIMAAADVAYIDDGGGWNTQMETPVVSDLEHRKLIRDANLSVETEEFDALLAGLEARVKFLGGYIENLSVSDNSRFYGNSGNRNAWLHIRIPAQHHDFFLQEVTSISNVLHRNESARDVTLQYVDVESRKRVLEVEQERLMELLKEAVDINTLLILERRLSEIRYQVESSEAQLRTFDNLVDFSTVSISINEVTELTPPVVQTVWERIGSGFMRSLRSVGNGLTNLFVFIIVALPFLLTFAVFGGVIALVIKLSINANKKKKKKQAEAANALRANQGDDVMR